MRIAALIARYLLGLVPVCAVEAPLGLTLLAPVILNILLFHIFTAPAGIALGIMVTILWFIVAASVSSAFTGILQSRTAS